MLAVSTEHLVAPIPFSNTGTPCSRAARAIRYVLIAAGSDRGSSRCQVSWKQFLHTRFDLDLVVGKRKVIGDTPGITAVVRHAFEPLIFVGIADGERVDVLRGPAAHERGNH